ncbi:Very-long-chain (3R)-3-hydroxyacyl-[acyl-carrier] dehydratase PASTICCINO 2 [Micractinium conductrix]|uniref:Very-long-chain (3R)-3-hydroxyacyl-CoA dehydratase n=1 Tax=Micractinium conductrix TaxID=554055 RepID=A0A2P6V1P9_9CHLO|nr:Very-long-chain (3R)-3-hydroxyacyl-[acyl-carrier] dehydratase PASTICCINO 2 [Micractinium conductrix]|eukprot:PSC68010.1 Very-long-chain (3R)-3-hydroxyacyl-[acyl-carrier] dehydratase PASTICCINO 2 [Micractinium conductrix]
MKRQLGEALMEYGYLQCATMKLAALGVQGCEERPLSSCAACDGAPVHINLDFNFSLCHNAKCGTSDVQLPPPNSQHYLRGEAVNQLLLESSGAAGTAAAADTPACSDFDAARVLGRTSKSHDITAVGVTMCRHSVVAHVMDIATGERYIYAAIMLYMLMVQHALQVVVVWYDINCKFGPWFKRWAVAKAVLLPVLQCAAAVLFPLPVWHRYAHSAACQGRNDALYAQGVGRQYHEPAETLWAWLGALGIITQYMTQRNRWGRIERALELWNQRQADRIVPLLCSMQASTEQAAAAASRATAATDQRGAQSSATARMAFSPKSCYLWAYNTALCAAWGYVLFLAYRTAGAGGSLQDVWQAVEVPLKVVQTAAIMEVLHSAVGLVRSPVMITATQVASRLFILWGVVVLAPAPRTSPLVLLTLPGGARVQLSLVSLLTAWCCSEVIRYSFFAFKELGMQPYLLLWLRYTAFIGLYPLGVASELAMVWLALPWIREHRPLSVQMPNAFNFGFDYYWACWAAVLAYLPGFPQLYFYMLAQRQRVLRGGRSSSSAKLKHM